MICCVTGHRHSGFTFERNPENIRFSRYNLMLYSEIKCLISFGYNHFISGMAEGADLDFAKAVIHLRDTEKLPIILECALPYPVNPSKRLIEYNKERDFILSKCDRLSIVSPYYHGGCMQKRNCYMVDKSDTVLAVWNGKESGGTWNTIKYAQKNQKPIVYIMLNEI